MIIGILFGLIYLCIIFGLVYLILFYPTKWFVKPQRLKIVRRTLSVFFGLLLIYWHLFTSPSSNNKNAIIEKTDNKYLVTITGKRALMVHDPFALLARGTYIDTFNLIIPRNEGLVKGEEIPTKLGNYKYLGSLTIKNDKMNLDLYYDNYDDKIKKALSWNGNYNVIWKEIK